STIIEEPFLPRLVRPTQATNGIDWASAPQLGGYVGTAERDTLSSPAITSLISDKDDPVYAVWQYGLGRAAAFTSDAKPRWAAGWMNWPGFGQFWTQAFRDALRNESGGGLAPRIEISAGQGHISVEATTPEGASKNNLRLRTHLIGPDLSTADITLDQTAAGQYEGTFPAVARGAYLVSISEADGEQGTISGAVNSYSPEFNIASQDVDLLKRISDMTGGQVIPAGNASSHDLFSRRSTRTIPHEIWATLMLAALILLPIDVGVRRVALTREQLAHAREWIQARVSRATTTSSVDAGASVSMAKLKDARSRVVFSDGKRDGTQPPATSPMPEVREQVSKPVAPGDAAKGADALVTRLLDARRKRRE
ncbi:MAG TPA: glutamine amidotransferase, partial [Blastocatellia bacterium]|nr:glutamine amidotransferase [Blastocatellia bacterium]